jgi:hypothetical protein
LNGLPVKAELGVYDMDGREALFAAAKGTTPNAKLTMTFAIHGSDLQTAKVLDMACTQWK